MDQWKIFDLRGHKDKVHSVSWNRSGRYLASGSLDHTVRLWTIEPTISSDRLFQISRELKGHTGAVEQLRWSPTNEDVLVTASTDKSICLWDSRTATCLKKISTSGENINICWHVNGDRIAVGNKDDLIIWLDTRTWNIIDQLQFPFEINEMTWNPMNGSQFFITTGNGTILVHNGEDLQSKQFQLQAHTANCYCIDFDPSGNYFAVGSADALISLWMVDRNGHEPVCYDTISRLEWPIRTLSFSFDGLYLAAGSEDKFIDISSPTISDEHIFKLSCQVPTNSISWHPNQHWLAYAGDDRSAALHVFRSAIQ